MENRTRTKTASAIIITVISYTLISLSWLILHHFVVNFQEIYNVPENKNGVMDMNGYDISTTLVSATMSGEWEFFYNKWIVTDNLDVVPDANIEIPKRWTGMKLEGERLGRHGYASYRMVVINPPEGSTLGIRMSTFPVGCRAYINGELNMMSGTVSKEKGESTSTGLWDYWQPYLVTDESQLEIVVEVGHNGYGGLFYPPWLVYAGRPIQPIYGTTNIIVFTMVGAMAACVLFYFIITLSTGFSKAKWPSMLFMLFLLFHLFTSNEFTLIFGAYLPFNFFSLMYELCFITGIIAVALFFISLLTNGKLIINRAGKTVYACIFLLVFVLYYALFGTQYQILPIVLGLTSLAYVFFKMLRERKYNPNFEKADLLILFILTFMFEWEAIYNLGLLNYGLEALVSVSLLIIMIITGVSAFSTLRKKFAKALQASELKRENEIIKYNVYKNQVNPHFIFNTLSSIQALYKQDNEAGDDAIGRFSRHLRRIVDSSNTELHSFDEELKIIMNYVELEKLRLKRSPQILFDINFQDFYVPVLSLQPLIENALRYSGVTDSEDGYIRIFSDISEDKAEIVLIVEDNGKGFDVLAIRSNSTGLKNTSERYRHLLNGEMEIKSAPDEGTAITIRFPYKENNCD